MMLAIGLGVQGWNSQLCFAFKLPLSSLPHHCAQEQLLLDGAETLHVSPARVQGYAGTVGYKGAAFKKR